MGIAFYLFIFYHLFSGDVLNLTNGCCVLFFVSDLRCIVKFLVQTVLV